MITYRITTGKAVRVIRGQRNAEDHIRTLIRKGVSYSVETL